MQVSYDSVGLELREAFIGRSDAELVKKMDDRKRELQAEGHTGFNRVKMGRNARCICGSGKKFKYCCIDKAR